MSTCSALRMTALGHVWTAPSWQGLSSRTQHWSVQPCVRPVDAVHMTAGHNALRGSGPGQKRAFDNALANPGTLAVCIREVQKSLLQSSKRLIETKIQKLGVGAHFQVLHDRIVTPGDGLIIFQGMQDSTAESIKSLEGFDIAWVEEAQTLSARSLSLLRPTIRKEGSELWANWNPRRKKDAIDEFLRQKKPDNAVVVKANWRDNPWFPAVLEEERRLDLEIYPERYRHIWEGDYASAFEGAYFAKALELARQEGRISRVAVDPILPVKAGPNGPALFYRQNNCVCGGVTVTEMP